MNPIFLIILVAVVLVLGGLLWYKVDELDRKVSELMREHIARSQRKP